MRARSALVAAGLIVAACGGGKRHGGLGADWTSWLTAAGGEDGTSSGTSATGGAGEGGTGGNGGATTTSSGSTSSGSTTSGSTSSGSTTSSSTTSSSTTSSSTTTSGGGAGGTGGQGAGGGQGVGGGGGEGGTMVVGDAYRGGLVFNDWTKPWAGGSSLPPGVDAAHVDFVRCAACHGWEVLGEQGGYVRRTATAFRPKPTEFSNLSKILGQIADAKVLNYLGDDYGVYDDVMPNYSNPGGLTWQQVLDAVEYLNVGPKVQDVAKLDITKNPVGYTFIGASKGAGATLYAARCQGCHGADGTKAKSATIGTFFSGDGAYSEGFHKMIYGTGGAMTRQASGSLTAAQARDILAYVQANVGGAFPLK